MNRRAKLVAIATIAVMLSTTAATLACAAGCANNRPVTADTNHCHEDAAAPSKVAAADDCRQHAIETSGSIARTEPLKVFSPDPSSVPGQPVIAVSVVSSGSIVRPPASPPDQRNIPLRI